MNGFQQHNPMVFRALFPSHDVATLVSSGLVIPQNPPEVLMVFHWAPVSEPGFLDFQIFRFSILEIILFCEIFLENMLVRYRGINNKGVLERP